MIESELTVDCGAHTLRGSVCLPNQPGRVPFVLMLHGTGPLDRDENMVGQRLNVFNTIATDLAARGIGSFRYDKRGCGKSSGNYYAAGHSDLVADAIACADALSAHESCAPEHLFLLGHSEGTLIAAQVSAERPSAGLLLLCPFVETTESLLIRQAKQIEKELGSKRRAAGLFHKVLLAIFGSPTQNQAKLIQRLRTSKRDTLRAGLGKLPAKALRELLDIDAESVFEKVTCPVLLLGAAKDLQCNPDDVGRIAELVKSPVTQLVVDNLTHVLRLHEGTPTLLEARRWLDQPVADPVLQAIGAWLAEQTGPQEGPFANCPARS